jgi:hypothetical protein
MFIFSYWFDPCQTIFPEPKIYTLASSVCFIKVEAHLKAFYKMFAHYANTKRNAALADFLTFVGIYYHNADICYQFAPMENLLLSIKILFPKIMTLM